MSVDPSGEVQIVTGIADALPINTSATTSRRLLDNDRARVVAFTFDTGEQLTEHTASLPVVVLVTAGAVRFEVAGEAHDLAPGDCVYLPAGQTHALEALAPSRLSLVMIRDPAA
jgi:quercetin dioxygenase-like cupin family protein